MKNNDYQDFKPDGIVLREVKTTEQRSKRENPRIMFVLFQSIATITHSSLSASLPTHNSVLQG